MKAARPRAANAGLFLPMRRALRMGLLLVMAPAGARSAPNFSLAPGVVISYRASPSSLDVLLGNDVYIADADIVVLPNGNYLASHSYFGDGSTETTAAMTRVFRSTNQGATWNFLIQFQPLWRASLFVYGGALYIIGPTHNGGSYSTIRKSTDNGSTWTTPVDASTGNFEAVPLAGALGTPNNPLVFNNRLYAGGGGRATLSTPTTTADPLVASDWRQSGSVQTFTTWQVGLAGALGSAFIGEGQAVASPETGVVVLGKVEGFPYTAVLRADRALGDMRFSPSHDFAAMPGGEKKFGAMYDAGSGKFFVLGNPILPAHAADASLTPQLKRNTAAVLSSRDLSNWEVEKIFLYSPNLGYEAWQYLQFDFDGGDLVVASRTAFDVGDTYRPPRGHDSNLLTFHRIPNFRTHVRDHYLLADTANHQVLRYEVNQNPNKPAPLGKFTLGASFAGTALTAPKDLAQSANGDVYIRENGGRILRFDALGNFLAVVASSPVAFATPQLSIVQPAAGERSWVKSGSGNWADPLNWYYWGRPDTTAEVATFGSAATAAATVTVDAAPLLWSFNTDADEEGWTTGGITGAAVAAGVFAGAASTAAPILNRVALSFEGSLCPEVRLRLKASGVSSTVDFYWGNTTADLFQSARKITVPYTGAGAFQDIVIPLAGNVNWDGKIITRIRFDLPKDAGATFEVDAIEIPRDSFRLKGLRFRNTPAYTISGTGSLRIEPDAGNGLVEVTLGNHVVGTPLTLAAVTDCEVATSASLNLAGMISGAGGINRTGSGTGTLRLSGANTFTGGCTWNMGTLELNGSVTSAVVVNGGIFKGSGTVSHNLTIHGGTHAPGASPGSMTVTKNYALDPGGTLQMELNGTTAGTQYDQLKVTGATSTVTLAGALDLIAAPGLVAGSTFTLINNSGNSTAVAGAFAGLPQNTEFYADAQWWRINYAGGTGNDVVLTRLTPAPWQNWQAANFASNTNNPAIAGDAADLDLDGIVNLLEYALGGSPLLSDPSPWPVRSTVAGKLTLTFTRTLANTDLTMTVQGAGVPAGPWTDLATSVNGAVFVPLAGTVSETGSGATRTVQASDQYLIADPAHPRRFLRVRVAR